MVKEKPTCPDCPDDADYRVDIRYQTKTQIASGGGYWGEDGEYVPKHDPNVIKTHYQCSNGHEWAEGKPVDPEHPRWNND